MNAKLEKLSNALQAALGDKIVKQTTYVGEITIEVNAADWLAVAKVLRDDEALGFEQLTDLCGVDYSTYGEGAWTGKRFAAVAHLLSYANNQRLRVRVFAEDDEFPMLDSVVEVWPIANWNEREAFDLYGIIFTGHPDLRRILSDYGFIGHPFRKDFPLVGNVEMRYDPEQRRVVYQPTSMENREMIPRVIRSVSPVDKEGYGA